MEGTRTEEERKRQSGLATKSAVTPDADIVQWESEPPLEASQCVFTLSIAEATLATGSSEETWTERMLSSFFRIAEIEDQIGAGLIEEVIQVAEGEEKLVDIMLESRS